jgi:DNA-binding NarL/FixJ family response regulator
VNKTLRVLIVDDLASNRQGLVALLEFEPDIEAILEAANGREAVQLVADEQPDVVLMDVRMPVMDGVEATRQIKARWPQVKVVVLTMYPSNKAEALAAGADRFLLKGSTGQSLPEIIRSLISSSEPGIA